MASKTIKPHQEKIIYSKIELKQELSKDDIQSILKMSKLLSDVSNDIKTYHFAIVDQL